MLRKYKRTLLIFRKYRNIVDFTSAIIKGALVIVHGFMDSVWTVHGSLATSFILVLSFIQTAHDPLTTKLSGCTVTLLSGS